MTILGKTVRFAGFGVPTLRAERSRLSKVDAQASATGQAATAEASAIIEIDARAVLAILFFVAYLATAFVA